MLLPSTALDIPANNMKTPLVMRACGILAVLLLWSRLYLWADSTVVFNELQYNPGN